MITIEELSNRFTIDPREGLIYHKLRGPKARPGDLAGWKDGNGYWVVSIGGNGVGAHRVIYFWVHGVWSDKENHIDHINRSPSDNRIENLRLVPVSDNAKNRGQTAKSSGLKGVIEDKRRKGRFYAKIGTKCMGAFSDKIEAAYYYDWLTRDVVSPSNQSLGLIPTIEGWNPGMMKSKWERRHNYIGVARHKNGAWVAKIRFMENGVEKCKSLGLHDTAEDAARAYDREKIRRDGPGARTNKRKGLLL